MRLLKLFTVALLVITISMVLYPKIRASKDQFQGSKQKEVLVNTPRYLVYSDTALASSQKNGKSVLFFAATKWCHTCSALDTEIIERQAQIPNEVTILKVDYDEDKAMNQKYGVTSQHTLIYLDNTGQEVNRWLGGGLDNMLQKLN